MSVAEIAASPSISATGYALRSDRGYVDLYDANLCNHSPGRCLHRRALFHTRSGLPTAELREDWIEPDFPAEPERPMAGERPDPILAKALGVAPKYVGINRFDHLVEVESEETLKTLKPNMKSLANLPVRGVIVTCASASGDLDFVSRFFAPGAGIDEDPVTGSAHCFLGPYWKNRLGKDEFIAYQAPERGGRGGGVRVRVAGERVILGGKAATILSGHLMIKIN